MVDTNDMQSASITADMNARTVGMGWGPAFNAVLAAFDTDAHEPGFAEYAAADVNVLLEGGLGGDGRGPARPETDAPDGGASDGAAGRLAALAGSRDGAPASPHTAPPVWFDVAAGAASSSSGAPAEGRDPSSSTGVATDGGAAASDIRAEGGGAIANVAATGTQSIDGLLSGVRWNQSITYSFPDSSADYPGYAAGSEPFSNFAQVSAQQMTAVHFALNADIGVLASRGFALEGFTDLTVSHAVTDSTANVRIGESSDPGTAWAYYPATQYYGGDVWFGTAYAGTVNDYRTPVAGNYAWHTMIHELGHAFGLKHGHEIGGPGNTAVPAARDSLEFNVMTYRSYVGGPTSGYSYEQWGAPQTFMMDDIRALQHMYGADFTTNNGNTVYSWNPLNGQTLVDGAVAISPGGNRIFATIWDGGGVDTYDLSAYSTNLNIDLRPGQHSTFSSTQLAHLGGGNDARGNIFNALQFNGDARSLIENANGGSGNDTIRGNAANNVLAGGAGNDSLLGESGNDTLNGDAGNDVIDDGFGGDTVNGGAGNDRIVMGDASINGDTYQGGSGVDTFDASHFTWATNVTISLAGGFWSYSAGSEAVTGFENIWGANGLANTVETLIGNGGNNVIRGNGGNDVIRGNGGNDTIDGGSGVDQMYGDAGNDKFRIFNGWTGGPGELIDGGTGVDTFDTSNASLTTSVIDLSAGTFNYTPGGSGTIQLISIENVVAGSANDTIIGNGSANRLQGGGGNDILNGDGGTDSLHGGTGNDRLIQGFGGPNEIMNGGSGNDTGDWSYSNIGDDWAISLLTGTANIGGTTFAQLTSIENVIGGQNDDTITGNALANRLDGQAGDDVIDGRGGGDTLIGGTGADTLIGGAGVDTADYSDSTAGVRVNLSSGVGSGGDAAGDQLSAIENLTGSAHNDVLWGNAGANRLEGGSGADRLIGGAGVDTADYSGSTVGVRVSLSSGTGSTGDAAGDQLSGIENLNGSAHADVLNGNVGANRLTGGAGADRLVGGAGADTLIGGAGDDRFVFGDGAGDDSILGFVAGAGTPDWMDFVGNTFLGSFVDFLANSMQVGVDTVIDMGGGDDLTLVGVSRLALHQDDFVF